MKVLVTGLGDIAAKAYLPVLAATPGLQLHLATRNVQKLRQLGQVHRIVNLHESVGRALDACRFDAAFVHAATTAHPELVQLLLEHGTAVFVDKPLADSLEGAARTLEVAKRHGRLLMVGFNRRYAPDYAVLQDHQRDLILMQKHRRGQPDQPRRTVFDDFIHVVDTLRFLSPAPTLRATIETVVRDGLLQSVMLTLAGDGYQAIGSMHRDSGLDEERLDIIGGGERRSVLNLSERIEQRNGMEGRVRRGDWTPVGRQRGFEAMCADFLQAVRERRQTAFDDILETHRMCEAIVAHAEANALS